MQTLGWYFNRLRSMDAAEIAWRVKGLAGAWTDVLRVSTGIVPRLDTGRWNQAGEFRPGFSCTAGLDEHDFDGGWPAEWRAALLRDAEMICGDRLSFFDLEDQFLGAPIDWQRDHAAGRSGPLRHCTFVDYRDFGTFGDCKLVWEPNRHHQLVVLARAWVVTGDERYARKAVDLMHHWIESNPFDKGMNWKSPLELGIRLVNWVWAIDLLRGSRALGESDWHRIVETVYRLIRDTQRKFSRGSSANNHLIGEVAGVFIATSYFDDLPNAARYHDRSRSILEEEILAQSFGDGCTREHAFGYQYFVLQFFALCAIAADRAGRPLSAAFLERLRQMLRFYAEVCADTGTPPNLGDADSGYVLDLGDRPPDARGILSVGAALFGEDALDRSATVSESCCWLFGTRPGRRDVQRPALASQAFRESGYFLLRAPAAGRGEAADIRVIFDCAELGYGAIAAHGHADCLGFELSVDGRPVLVDAGTYDYFTWPDWRRYFRSTRAHNALTVDDECQSVPSGPFMWKSRARQKLVEWRDDETQSCITGEHDGYRRLPDPVTHRRRLSLDKADGSIDIVDELECAAEHRIRRYFHVAPGCTVAAVDGSRIRIATEEFELTVRHDSATAEIVAGGEDGPLGWVSFGYHQRAAGHTLVLTDSINPSRESGLAAKITVNRRG